MSYGRMIWGAVGQGARRFRHRPDLDVAPVAVLACDDQLPHRFEYLVLGHELAILLIPTALLASAKPGR